MKKLAFLEYAFIFDPDSTYSNVYDFENKLGKFFKGEGMEAEIIDAVKGYTGRRVIFVRKIEDVLDNPAKKGPMAPFKNEKKINL